MELDFLREQCLSLPYVTEGTPFGPTVLVFKVLGKMFALVPLDTEVASISLKNTPEKNVELREEHEGIQGAFHMNKTHWNMVLGEFPIKKSLVVELILESHQLVYHSLPKKIKYENPL